MTNNPWSPESKLQVKFTEKYLRGKQSHPIGIGYPYPRVEVEVDDPSYTGPIKKIVSVAVDPGGGGYPDCLDSFKILGLGDQEIASTYSAHNPEIYIKSPEIDVVDLADAIQAFSMLAEAQGYTVRGNLYRALDEEQMKTMDISQDQIVYDENKNPRKDRFDRTWVIQGKVTRY